MDNNLINKLKPYKIVGCGSQGIIILPSDDKYIVKIYIKNNKNLKMTVKIIQFFIKCKNLPKTIYKSYYITEKINSINRYISNNNLPNHFSISINNENELERLIIKYNMKPKLFEVMNNYKITFNNFIHKLFLENEKNNNTITNNINILTSLFFQGIITLLWLTMKKGIIHFDINTSNFFIESTNDTEFEIEIEDMIYNVPLYGYYLIISDFGYARSIELLNPSEYESNVRINLESYMMHPWEDTVAFIKIFRNYLTNVNISLYDLDINLNECNKTIIDYTHKEYKNMLLSYYNQNENFKKNVKIFKKAYFNVIKRHILKK
jgi:hypothetical protein